MEKGFFEYYGHGWNIANENLKNINFKEKMFLLGYMILSLLGRIIIFTRPIFEISDNNLVKMMEECHRFSLDKIFEGATDSKTYSQLLFAYIIKFLTILGNLVLYLIPFAAYWGVTILFGYAYGSDVIILLYVAQVVSLIVGILCSVFIIVMFIYQEPMAYIAQKNLELDASDIMYNSTSSLKNRGKWNLFATDLITLLIFIVTLAVAFFGIYASFSYLGVIGGFLALILLFVLIFVFANFYPVLFMAGKCAKHTIIKEVAVVNKIVVVKPVVGDANKVEPLFKSESFKEENSDVEF